MNVGAPAIGEAVEVTPDWRVVALPPDHNDLRTFDVQRRGDGAWSSHGHPVGPFSAAVALAYKLAARPVQVRPDPPPMRRLAPYQVRLDNDPAAVLHRPVRLNAGGLVARIREAQRRQRMVR